MITKRQLGEIESLREFSLQNIDYSKALSAASSDYLDKSGRVVEINESPSGVSPEEAYFKITDAGEKLVAVTNKGDLLKLLDAKKWRLRMIEMYEDDMNEGVFIGYHTVLGFDNNKPVSRSTAEFIAKTMFSGADYKQVMDLYNNNIKANLNA